MKNKIVMMLFLFSIAACSEGGDGSTQPTLPDLPSGGGTFHPGPYTDPATGKFCNAPVGYCEGDKKCHSSQAKCPK